jgi:hypothetical protein
VARLFEIVLVLRLKCTGLDRISIERLEASNRNLAETLEDSVNRVY